MSLESLTPEESKKVKETIEAGEQVLAEMNTLREDLKEYVSNLADEMNIKPATINKAIKLAYKQRSDNAVEQAQEEMTDVETLLAAAGKI